MQSLKDLALMVSKRKQRIKFFSNKEICHLSPSNMCKKKEKKKKCNVHDLLDVIKNHTKFKLNQIRTQNFQLKLFDTAVTLKYNQGH